MAVGAHLVPGGRRGRIERKKKETGERWTGEVKGEEEAGDRRGTGREAEREERVCGEE